MIQDLHSHTYYSYCGNDSPDALIKTAIKNGIEFLGISDHCHGVMTNYPTIKYGNDDIRIRMNRIALDRYYDHIMTVAHNYRDYIKVWCGVEITTIDHGYYTVPDECFDFSRFDYCFIENIEYPESTIDDLLAFKNRLGCKVCGLPHIDLPAYIRSKNEDMVSFFKKMAENNIFWELNVNRDSTHNYKEHEYVKKFFEDEEVISAVKESGLTMSVGFDCHRIEDYDGNHIKETCQKLEELKIPMVKY